MGVDYFNCDKCNAITADCEDHGHCGGCGSVFCGDCYDELKEEENAFVCDSRCDGLNKCSECKLKHGKCGKSCDECWKNHYACSSKKKECSIRAAMTAEQIKYAKKYAKYKEKLSDLQLEIDDSSDSD